MTNSFSFIANGSIKKPYTAKNVLEIMPKLIMTQINDMMSEKTHTSILVIRRLFNFIRLFKWFISKDPSIQEHIDQKVLDFKSKPDKRLKNENGTPNLGDLLVFATMSHKIGYQDIVTEYVDEQLDRQVFWWVQTLPEIDFEDTTLKNKGRVDEERRLEVCFQLGK